MFRQTEENRLNDTVDPDVEAELEFWREFNLRNRNPGLDEAEQNSFERGGDPT